MSRRALLNFCNSQPPQDKKSRLTLLMGSTRLPLLFVAALALTLFLASGNVTAEKLFQSPQSPPPEQPPAEQPPVEQPPAEQPPAEQPPAEQPPAEQPPVEQPPAEQPATEQTTVEESAPTTQSTSPVSPVSPVNSTGPTAVATLEPPAPMTAPPADQVEYSSPAGGDTPMTLDEAELIDTVIVSGAYIWLCCGVIFLLLIPLFMLILYIRGRSKIVNEEGF